MRQKLKPLNEDQDVHTRADCGKKMTEFNDFNFDLINPDIYHYKFKFEKLLEGIQ